MVAFITAWLSVHSTALWHVDILLWAVLKILLCFSRKVKKPPSLFTLTWFCVLPWENSHHLSLSPVSSLLHFLFQDVLSSKIEIKLQLFWFIHSMLSPGPESTVIPCKDFPSLSVGVSCMDSMNWLGLVMICLLAVCYLAASYLCTVEKFRQDLLLGKQESRVGTKVFWCLSTPLGFFL